MKKDAGPAKSASKPSESSKPVLIEGVDYYLQGALMVFTAEFLLRRGYCCESGCRNCPYGFEREETEE